MNVATVQSGYVYPVIRKFQPDGYSTLYIQSSESRWPICVNGNYELNPHIVKDKGSRKKVIFFSGPATKRGGKGLATKKERPFLKL